MKIIGDIKDKNILLLQGPMGTFFRSLGTYFIENGGTVFTICFNAGDQLFALPHNHYLFNGPHVEWKEYISGFLKDHQIDMIFLFGNCRFYHKRAISVAKQAGIGIFVFEEGYVRPHFVTLEKNGVNGESAIPDDPHFYDKMNALLPVQENNAQNSYLKMAAQATLYYIVAKLQQGSFPQYRHHRELSLFKELCFGVRGFFRKVIYSFTEKNFNVLFEGRLKESYFLVPLQTRTDYQLIEYSRYGNIEDFIDEVLESFSRHAPPDTSIVFKHHPMERGKLPHTDFINTQAKHYGIADRVLVVHDIHLPTCLKNARGTVTINSTVGFSSLFHETPTKTLGKAIYDIEGLTCKYMSLDQFWKDCKKPDRDLFLKFRNYVISTTQLNGSFYGNFPDFSD